MQELDSHKIILNLDRPSTGNTTLNFNDQEQSIEQSSYTGNINAQLLYERRSKIIARYDLNFNLGVLIQNSFRYELAKTREIIKRINDQQSFILEMNFYIPCLEADHIECLVFNVFDPSIRFFTHHHVIFEQATSLYKKDAVLFEHSEIVKIEKTLKFETSLQYQININDHWQERIRLRRNQTYQHEIAQVIDQTFQYPFDDGLEAKITRHLIWQKAQSIYYRKSKIAPWPKPKVPEYQGSTILNFVDPFEDIDPFDVILNFGECKVIPQLYPKSWWYIVNEINVTRLDNNQKIRVYDGSYSTDKSRWCWTYNLTIPESEISKLEPINGQPVFLKIVVNGDEHHMMLESRSRSQKFASITYSLTGRSITSLLDSPYSSTRSFTQENERTSVQLAQAELDRANQQIDLKWQLIDELGWILQTDSLSYSNLTPIAALKLLSEAGGGFIYSEKSGRQITIKPLYKKMFWNVVNEQDYDVLIPESIVTDLSTDYELYPDYNGITLTNDRTGLTGQIKRRDTAGDVLCESVNNVLFEASSMEGFSKSRLAKAGMVETHQLVMPLTSQIAECLPGDLIGYNGQWWGTIESVSVSFSYAAVSQTIKIERINRDE